MTIFKNQIININHQKTNIRLAYGEWDAINTICEIEKIKKNILFELINANKSANLNLTSSIRLFCITYLINECSKTKNYKKTHKKNTPIEEAISYI